MSGRLNDCTRDMVSIGIHADENVLLTRGDRAHSSSEPERASHKRSGILR